MAVTKLERIQSTFFDLEKFEDVTVAKDVNFTSVESVDEAVARLGGDTKKLLAVVNDGLRSEFRRVERANPAGYRTFVDPEAPQNGELNGEYSGSLADVKYVNQSITNFAKMVFPDEYESSRAVAKAKAIEMIKATPSILAALKKNAVVQTPATDEPEA